MTEKIPPHSSWNLPPTPRQIRAITSLCASLGFQEPHEEKVRTRYEARNMIAGLREELKKRRQWDQGRTGTTKV